MLISWASQQQAFKPAVQLDFTTGALDPRITFTRFSTGTYVNSTGVLTSAPANTPRFDYDPATLAPKGLLIESQRTNLLLRSEEFDDASWAKGAPVSITANYAVSPDGTADADRFVSTGGAYPQVYQSFTLTAGQPYTFSVWVKSDGTSQIQQTLFLDGSQTNFTPTATWTRISVTVASSTGGSKSAVIATNDPAAAASSFLIWGAQLEAGASATSYIPTVASQVTRVADTASIVAPNFAPWYNQAEGTIVVDLEFGAPPPVTSQGVIGLTNGTFTESMVMFQAPPFGNIASEVIDNGIIQAVNAILPGSQKVKAGFCYKANSYILSAGGVAGVEDTSCSVPTISQLNIGSVYSSGDLPLNGHIRSIRYFPTRLSNAQLQALSA